MTEVERKVIGLLTACGDVHDCYNKPIRDLAKQMGWKPDEARLFVKDMVARKLVRPVAGTGRGRVVGPPVCHWEEVLHSGSGDSVGDQDG